MSLITDIVVCVNKTDEIDVLMKVNKIIDPECSDSSAQKFGLAHRHKAGGTKVFCNTLLYAAFNYFGGAIDFIERLRDLFKKEGWTGWVCHNTEDYWIYTSIDYSEEE